MDAKIEGLKGKLIVSCQALPHEPLHSSFIMGRMALAAKEGGALGIRANTREDIREIQEQVDLPVIGIVKRDYDDSKIYITPTMKEVDELMEVKPEIIAMDATDRLRPGGKTLDMFFKEVKEKYPDQRFMADCSTVEEALLADKLGFDFIGTTLVGYTEQSRDLKIEHNDFEIIREIVAKAVSYTHLAKRYGDSKGVRLWAWISNVPSLLGIFIAQLLACGGILSGFGIPFKWGVIITAVVILIYCTIGGMWGVVLTDVIQTAVIVVGIPILFIAVLYQFIQGGGSVAVSYTHLEQY